MTPRRNRPPAGKALLGILAVLIAPFVITGCQSLGANDPDKTTHGPVSHPDSSETVAICPVSLETVDPEDPEVVAYAFAGKTYLFRDPACLEAFKENPGLYLDARIMRSSNIQP